MSRIELSRGALKNNIAVISKIAPLNRIYAVLKDNAYGHGLIEFGAMCADEGVQNVIVRNTKEALALNEMFKTVLCLAEISNFDAPQNVEFAVNSTEVLTKIPNSCCIHLKVDTGMHRNGIDPFELGDALELIVAKGLKLKGVFSHLRSADELSTESFWQEKNFLTVRRYVEDFCASREIDRPLFHIQNSAGFFRSFSMDGYDMARIGIALYGYLDMPKSFNVPPLRPVLSLWADKIASRRLKNGSLVGYGATGKIYSDTTISSYDIGYADGFFRVAADGDYFLPDGSRVVGRVSMDSICVESDKSSVCVFNDASVLAKRYNTISYEILTRLSPDIRRVVV